MNLIEKEEIAKKRRTFIGKRPIKIQIFTHRLESERIFKEKEWTSHLKSDKSLKARKAQAKKNLFI